MSSKNMEPPPPWEGGTKVMRSWFPGSIGVRFPVPLLLSSRPDPERSEGTWRDLLLHSEGGSANLREAAREGACGGIAHRRGPLAIHPCANRSTVTYRVAPGGYFSRI